MALDFSHLQTAQAETGHIDFSALGAVPAVGGAGDEEETSMLGAAGRGAVGMLPLGEQAYAGIESLVDKAPYIEKRRELEKDIEADKANHAGARLAGQAAGLIAPAILTGGASAPESMAAAAGEGALVGSAFGAGNAIDTVAGGGTKMDAAKNVAAGAALGGAGGAAAKLLGQFFAKAPSLETEAIEGGIPHPTVPAASIAGEPVAAGESPTMMGVGRPLAMGEAKGPTAMAESASEMPSSVPPNPVAVGTASPIPAGTPGLPISDNELRARMLVQTLGGSARQVRKLPGKDLVQTLNKMGDVFEENNLISPLDRFNARLKKFQALHDSAGKTIGETVDSANIAPIQVQPLLDDLAAARKFPSPLQTQQLSAAADQIKRYAGPEGTLSFQRLHQLKVDLGKEAFQGQGDPILQAAYHVVGNAQDEALEKVGQQVNKPAFDKAKAAYQATERALPMLRMANAKSLVNKPSLTELLSGHPLAAASSLVKEPLTRAANAIGFKVAGAVNPGAIGEALGRTGSQTMASTGATMGLNIDHPALAQWKPVFQKSAEAAKNPGEVEKSHAVTDFVLSQRDPAYAKAKQTAADAPMAEQNPTGSPIQMAEGGVVPEETRGHPGFGSTLQGLADQLKHPTHGAQPVAAASPSGTNDQFHQPFNPDFSDKLRAFLEGRKEEDDAEPR